MSGRSDRISALRAMSLPDIAALLSRTPTIVGMLTGQQPMVPQPGAPAVSRGDISLTHLGVLLSAPQGIQAAIRSLNQLERQLLVLAALHDGAVERPTVVAEAGDHRQLDEAVDALALMLLAFPRHEEGAWLVLRPGVLTLVPFPGPRIFDALGNLRGADLDVLLQRLGAEDLPYDYTQRRRMVGQLLRQPALAEDLRDALEPEPRRILDLLVEHGSQRVADMGLPPFDAWDRRGGPLHSLVQAGMIGVDPQTQRAFAWIDLRYALRGRLFDDWRVSPPPAEPAPLADPGARTPTVIRRVQSLLELWATEPAPALAAGGIGVKAMRAAAKGLGIDETQVAVLAHLMIALGLLGPTDEDDRWAPTPGVPDFLSLAPVAQWAALVEAWIHSQTIDEAAGLPNRWNGDTTSRTRSRDRLAVLEVLSALAEGTGVAEDVLEELTAWHHPDAIGDRGADAVVGVLRLLDLVPETGPVGLTGLARALRQGGAAGAAAVLGPPLTDIIVQADHTVIGAPGLAPSLAHDLSAIAELESDAGAMIWRITAAKVAQAMADGRTREQILGLLTRHSTVEVPGNVRVTIDDAAERHGSLRAGTVGCYLRCDDPATLAGAAAVSAARLRVIAPTVAVSPLAREAMLKALRARGIVGVAEDADGALLPPRRTSGRPLHDVRVGVLAEREVPDVYELATALLSGDRA